jgi:hypothetical protein
MWDAKHGMHLIRQPSHSDGTQSVPFPSFLLFLFFVFLGTIELRLQTDDCCSSNVCQVCLTGLSQRRLIMESRCSCRLFASSLEIGLVPGGAKTPRGTVWSIDSGPGSLNAGQQRGLPRPGQLSETRIVDPATGIGNGFWALAEPHCQGGMQSAETMPSWPRLWGFVGRRQIANWKPCRAASRSGCEQPQSAHGMGACQMSCWDVVCRSGLCLLPRSGGR